MILKVMMILIKNGFIRIFLLLTSIIGNHFLVDFRKSVSPRTKKGYYRNITCCPSTMPFDLILGHYSHYVDEPCEGILRFSGHWILTNVCVMGSDTTQFLHNN
ncbi:photosystem i p700 chlorophyll a apoprotein a2 [Phtheirospermum japonicum]|uniref:Photosystem i p700 chlorophyll a apoprotein a2 n=1 Tax=Phtheirospermum japonicum TaxID=374723 RepID=A0A830BQJ6_9LAMI|nr:photosystem i p700 chlorophyll a apoprotein a2 [Phtheirospermum japonicum]